MEYLESGSSHLHSKIHDPVMDIVDSKEDAFTSTLRRAREDSHFRIYFLSALTSGDDKRISTIFSGLGTDDPRLSALIKAQLAKREARIGKKKGFATYLIRGKHDALIAEMHREGRKDDAKHFRREYYYGSSMDQKTFVWPGGTYPWTDKSSGITWVGVHGMDSIGVVTRAGDLDLTRVHRYLKYLTVEAVLRKFRKTVISEIEDLASPSSKLCESFGQSIPKPFGVVSVVLGTDDAHEESGHKASCDEDEEAKEKEKKRQQYMPKVAGYDEKKTIKFLREQMRRDTTLTINETVKASSTEYHESKAIEFLMEKMKMNIEAFTVDETIKTAISAFQHLFQKKFKANEIEVSVMDPNYFLEKGEFNYKDIHAKHLEMNDIEDHLAAINEPAGSVGSGSGSGSNSSSCN